LKVSRRFGGTSPSSIGLKKRPSALLATCFLGDILPGIFFDHDDGGDMFLRNVGLLFNRLHSVIFQNLELFITTCVRTSNSYTIFIYFSLCAFLLSSSYSSPLSPPSFSFCNFCFFLLFHVLVYVGPRSGKCALNIGPHRASPKRKWRTSLVVSHLPAASRLWSRNLYIVQHVLWTFPRRQMFLIHCSWYRV
jgi:hypothetical protein